MGERKGKQRKKEKVEVDNRHRKQLPHGWVEPKTI